MVHYLVASLYTSGNLQCQTSLDRSIFVCQFLHEIQYHVLNFQKSFAKIPYLFLRKKLNKQTNKQTNNNNNKNNNNQQQLQQQQQQHRRHHHHHHNNHRYQ